MHTDEMILARVNELLRDVLSQDSLVLLPEMTARDVPGWDSLAHVSLMMSIQRAFKIRLSASESSRVTNIAALVDLIRRKLGPLAPPTEPLRDR